MHGNEFSRVPTDPVDFGNYVNTENMRAFQNIWEPGQRFFDILGSRTPTFRKTDILSAEFSKKQYKFH